MTKKKVASKKGGVKDEGAAADADVAAAKAEEKAAKKAAKEARRAEKKASGKGGRKKLGKQTVVFFMGQLIAAGHVGAKIPEESGAMSKIAQRIRQMAEKLARATLRHGEGDISLGGGGEEGSEETEE